MRKYLDAIILGAILAFAWASAFAGVNPISCVQSVTAGTGMTVSGTNPNPTVSLSATDSQAETFTSSITVTGNLETDGYFQTFSRTKAQLGAIVPTAVGQLYYCSDCTALRTCISTGTAQGAFSSPVAATTACN